MTNKEYILSEMQQHKSELHSLGIVKIGLFKRSIVCIKTQ